MTKPKHSLIVLPNVHLRQRSKRVGVITADIRQLIADMEATVLAWEDSRQHEVGVALAAVQVDVDLRVIVVRSNFDDKTDRSFKALINPEITKYEGEVLEDFEGCLSITDIYGRVPRHTKVRLKALDLNGRPFRISAEGFLARVFQHEIDHTNGIMFIDHIKDKSDAFFKLGSEGHLEPLDYEKNIRTNSFLW